MNLEIGLHITVTADTFEVLFTTNISDATIKCAPVVQLFATGCK